jgi:hypothetical protein
MKRGLFVLFLLILAIAFFPSDIQAIGIGRAIIFHPCIRADGNYSLGVEVVEGMGNTLTLNQINSYTGYDLWGRTNHGEWKYYGQVSIGWTTKLWGLPEGTTVDFYFGYPDGDGLLSLTLGLNGISYYSIKLEGTDYPHCETCSGKPLFKMYLLARADSYCLIVSDLPPSVERQKALCFPGTDWVATSTPCVGYVCDEDCWECDYLGSGRLSLKDLRAIYERHLSQTE